MKNSTENFISGNQFYHREMDYKCIICKGDTLPENIYQKTEIKSLLSKFKMKSEDLSSLINKCSCKRNTPKAHKLCVLLNILYNFELKCPECHSEYNISVKVYNIPSQNISNKVSLILVLLINILIYGVVVFLILYPLIIKKEYYNGEGKKAFFVSFCFFAALLFFLNTYLTYITFIMFLIKNPNDPNDYALEVKDINDQNKNKKTDKHYILLYKFFRKFYNTQIRYLVSKKQKNNSITKGNGNFNKELQEMILNNNIECEKEMGENFNGGNDILGLKINRIKIKDKKENNNKILNNVIEKSNGNIVNSDDSEDEENKHKDEKEIKLINNIISSNNVNANLNLALNKNNIKNNNDKSSKKSIDIISKNSNSKRSEKSKETSKQKKKKIVIELINTDKPNTEIKNINLKEERKNQENESNKTKKSDSNISKKNKNKKNENNSMSSKDIKVKNKLFEESKESFKNKKEENNKIKDETSIKDKLLKESNNNIFNDNDSFFMSTPFHNNGK